MCSTWCLSIQNYIYTYVHIYIYTYPPTNAWLARALNQKIERHRIRHIKEIKDTKDFHTTILTFPNQIHRTSLLSIVHNKRKCCVSVPCLGRSSYAYRGGSIRGQDALGRRGEEYTKSQRSRSITWALGSPG